MKTFILLIFIFTLRLTIGQTYDSINFKKLINEDACYEISYPEDWVIKAHNRPEKGDTVMFEIITIDNISEAVIVAGGGPLTENGTSFGIQIWKSTRGGRDAKNIEESIKQGSLSSSNVNKRLKQVKDTIIGGQNLKVWFGQGWASCGIDFIYKDKFYRFSFMSGSKDQFIKEKFLFDKMISSLILLD